MTNERQIVYLNEDQADDLAERINARIIKYFGYSLEREETEAMAQLLQDVGVSVDDIIDVSYLADNLRVYCVIVRFNEEGVPFECCETR